MDRVLKFAYAFTFRSLLETRSSSYFVRQNNCIPADLRRFCVESYLSLVNVWLV